jgi:hypothetical protein
VAVLVHGLILALAVSGAAVAFHGPLGAPRRAIGALAALLGLGLLALSLSTAAQARRHAEMIAGQNPFCIQVPVGKGSYRPATALLDLSPFSMIAAGLQYHGVLVVLERGTWIDYNWSHRSGRWERLADDLIIRPVVRCVPRPEYGVRMAWIWGSGIVDQPRDAFYRLSGRSFLIPLTFKPRVVNDTYLSFLASAPDFEPIVRVATAYGEHSWRTAIEFRSRDWLESVTKSDKHKPADLSIQEPMAANEPALYVERNMAGAVGTAISCMIRQSPEHPAPCQHWFYFDDAMWSFQQSIDDLPRWRAIQQALRERVAAFRSAGAQCEAGPC